MTRAGRRPLIAGNWKMNLTHLEGIALVQKLARSLDKGELEAAEVAVLPPFTALRSVQTLIESDKLALTYGAQDLSPHESGAFTGDVSGAMLTKLGCQYVLVGHSERRRIHREYDDVVNAKVKAALRCGLTPILCIGEDSVIRSEGAHIQMGLVQLDAALIGVSEEQAANIVVAYEPVWAIGTGQVAQPADAQELAAAVRRHIAWSYDVELATRMRILYGGSVSSSNADDILSEPDVDGALVGGASLKVDDFAAIVRASAKQVRQREERGPAAARRAAAKGAAPTAAGSAPGGVGGKG